MGLKMKHEMPGHIRELLDRPKWARLTAKGSPAVRAVECNGATLVKLKSGRYTTSVRLPKSVLRWVGSCEALTRTYVDGLQALGCFSGAEAHQLRDHFARVRAQREVANDGSLLRVLASTYAGVKVPAVLKRKKGAVL